MPPKLLLTGAPGVGKTTVIKKIALALGQNAAGFYTEESRESGRRTGFDIITLDGRRAMLSRKGKKSRYKVGKYGVDLQAIDSVAVSAIDDAIGRNKTIIIDEIGKMELFSRSFRGMVVKAFETPNPMVAVIMLKSNPFADSIKRRADVEIIQVTESNRDALPSRILKQLGI